MEFKIEIWEIRKLLDILREGTINLNPPYQRNPIWTKTTQKILINSIKDGNPTQSHILPTLDGYKISLGS